jgi:hypothetical protein
MNSDTAAIVFMVVLWGGFIIGAIYVWRDKRRK